MNWPLVLVITTFLNIVGGLAWTYYTDESNSQPNDVYHEVMVHVAILENQEPNQDDDEFHDAVEEQTEDIIDNNDNSGTDLYLDFNSCGYDNIPVISSMME